MSLERALEDCTKAIESLIDALSKLKGEPAERSARSSGKDGEAAPARRGRPRSSPADKVSSTADIRKAFGEYLAVKEEDEYDKRREFVEAILSEIGADKISDASDKDMVRAYNWLQQHIDGKRVNFAEDNDGDRGRDRDGDRGRDDDRGGRGGRSLV